MNGGAPPPEAATTEDSPGIRVLPPLVYLGAFGLAGLADRLRPWPLAASWVALERLRWLGAALLAAGVALDLWSLGHFIGAKTSALPFRPARAFVARGPYRVTRNPMYLGMTLTLLAVGLLLGRTWIALAALAGALAMDRYAIPREERYLERRFGAAYLDYKRRVRRWL